MGITSRRALLARATQGFVAATFAALALCAPPAGAHKRKPPAPVVLRSVSFRQVFPDGQPTDSIQTAGRYVLLHSRATDRAYLLIDEQTGKRTLLAPPPAPPPGCGDAIIGGPWILVFCGNSLNVQPPQLYSLADGAWRTALGASPSGVRPAAVGAYWFQYGRIFTCHHCSSGITQYNWYQSLDTGASAIDPTDATTIPDLNSPGLARKVCRPVRVPEGEAISGRAFGSLSFYGPFAVAEGEHVFLERCGTRLHERLDSDGYGRNPIGNPHEIIWTSAPTRLSGVFLPSLRRFTIALHGFLTCPGEIALSSRNLYVIGCKSRLWMAPAPRLAHG